MNIIAHYQSFSAFNSGRSNVPREAESGKMEQKLQDWYSEINLTIRMVK